MVDKKKTIDYADVWGDRVRVAHMLCAMAIGVIVCLGLFLVGRAILSGTNLDETMMKSYSLLFGLAGALISALISGILFKPKRILNEETANADLEEVVKDLQLDMDAEAAAVAKADRKTIQEMKDLGLYEVFAGGPEEVK